MKNYLIILTIFFIFCGPSVDCEYEINLAESEVRDLLSKAEKSPRSTEGISKNLVIAREIVIKLENHKTFLQDNEECVNLLDTQFSKPSEINDLLITTKSLEVQLMANLNK